MRKHAPGINPIVAMNKCESLHCDANSFAEAAIEAQILGFGEPIAISAETGLGMMALYEALRPMLEDYMVKVLDGKHIVKLFVLHDQSSCCVVISIWLC